MKKFIFVSIMIMFIFVLTGCGKGTSNNNANNTANNTGTNSSAISTNSTTGSAITYKDGVYDVKHKSTKPGYEEAVVTIKNNKIQSIDLKRLDDNSKEVNYDDWDGTKGGKPNLKQFRIDLANAMISKQSPDVDAISGATQSSEGWKAAVTDALAKAK